MEGLYVLLAGFLLGIEHAFDPDHIVAVSNIVSEHKNVFKSAFLGISWGLGHTLTLLITGLLILVLKLSIPASLVTKFELAVGVVLVALGILTLVRVFQTKVHSHAHRHGSESHAHAHADDSHYHVEKRSFFVGMVHGLAGSAALMLLILSTVQDAFSGLLYIAIFGIGSIFSMMCITTLLGVPFVLTSSRFSKLNGAIRLVSGVIGIVFGLFIIYSTGFR